MNGVRAHLKRPGKPPLSARSSPRCKHLLTILMVLFLVFIAAVPASVAAPLHCQDGSCKQSEHAFAERTGPPHLYGSLSLTDRQWPKDFALIARDSSSMISYHLFYILMDQDPEHESDVELGHARSSDLVSWEVLPSVLHV